MDDIILESITGYLPATEVAEDFAVLEEFIKEEAKSTKTVKHYNKFYSTELKYNFHINPQHTFMFNRKYIPYMLLLIIKLIVQTSAIFNDNEFRVHVKKLIYHSELMIMPITFPKIAAESCVELNKVMLDILLYLRLKNSIHINKDINVYNYFCMFQEALVYFLFENYQTFK